MKRWKEYERLVSILTAEEYGNEELTVIPNARIRGRISDRKRQIDVLVDYRFKNDLSRRIIFDAKDRKRPVDIKEVESFEGLMRDVQATNGVIVCTNGYTKSALRRAQEHIKIKLLNYDEVENIDFGSWDLCRDELCGEGIIFWDLTPGIIIEESVYVQATGKCDSCGKFHVWCWSCGNRRCIDYESEFQCDCTGPWFWLTSIEDDEDDGKEIYKSHYLLLVLGNGHYFTMDRRPI